MSGFWGEVERLKLTWRCAGYEVEGCGDLVEKGLKVRTLFLEVEVTSSRAQPFLFELQAYITLRSLRRSSDGVTTLHNNEIGKDLAIAITESEIGVSIDCTPFVPLDLDLTICSVNSRIAKAMRLQLQEEKNRHHLILRSKSNAIAFGKIRGLGS